MNGSKKQELARFKRWLAELSWEELQNAMTFSLETNTLSNQSPHQLERDLLREMVRLQVPPSTPIHPRAISYTTASLKGVTDGRSEEEHARYSRKHRPRLLQWNEQRLFYGKGKGKPPKNKIFSVVARKCVTPDGSRLPIGSTAEQRDADETLVNCAFLDYTPCGDSTLRVRLCPIITNEASPSTIIRLLKVASRGNFGAAPLPTRPASSSVFVAPWLEPTERWFSLAMYLANRFEVALWDSFRQGPPPKKQAVDSTLTPHVLQSALAEAMRQMIAEDLAQLSPTQRCALRDSVVFGLLDDGTTNSLGGRGIVAPSLMCPLSSWDSPKHRFQLALRDCLQRQRARLIEESLLEQIEPQFRQKKKARTKKSNRRRRQARNKCAPAVPKSDHETVHSGSSDDDEAGPKTPHRPHVIDFPKNKTSARDRNRNTVLAMSVLDDVMVRVFVDVGLEQECRDQRQTADHVADTSGPISASTGSGVVPVEESHKDFEAGDFPASNIFKSKVTSDPLAHGDRFANQSLWPFGNKDFFLANESPDLDLATAADYRAVFRHGQVSGRLSHDLEPQKGAKNVAWGSVDDWEQIRGFSNRERSILEEFFHSQERPGTSKEEMIMAASTAASIDSMSEGQSAVVSEGTERPGSPVHDTADHGKSGEVMDLKTDIQGRCASPPPPLDQEGKRVGVAEISPRTPSPERERIHAKFDGQSLSPPSTPSPTLSPILVSLGDLKNMQNLDSGRLSLDDIPPRLGRSLTTIASSSLPPSPRSRRLVSSLSRENLQKAGMVVAEKDGEGIQAERFSPHSDTVPTSIRTGSLMTKSRDDTDIKSRVSIRRSVDALSSYRNVAARPVMFSRDDHDIRHFRMSPPKSSALSSYRNAAVRGSFKSASSAKTSLSEAGIKPFNHLHFSVSRGKGRDAKDFSAHSEITGDGFDDGPPLLLDRRHTTSVDEGDNNTITRDGSTTITSAMSPRDSGDNAALLEERDTYRDLCLTLGAEVAKLKNMLAAQKSSTPHGTVAYAQPGLQQFQPFSFDPESVASAYHSPRPRPLAAMSDAGYRAEYESLASEEAPDMLLAEGSRATIVGSDLSIDQNVGSAIQESVGVALTRGASLPAPNGLRSRLTGDILKFLSSIEAQLREQDSRRSAAAMRMTRLVKTVWPRAQVKLYGSHVTGLCLPSSDIDFVICLPAVHKNAVADAPGALEGRNAINETSQKLLARRMKGESWIEPRTIKLIDRTAVPVIKVTTKDTKARSLQLDITFDGPLHHGLHAAHMVKQMMEELPMSRALVLVLKQFLNNRGLLASYTGGLSSYCLFLMVVRYLQEQPASWSDCGSLLMGFLDFYGNFVSAVTSHGADSCLVLNGSPMFSTNSSTLV